MDLYLQPARRPDLRRWLEPSLACSRLCQPCADLYIFAAVMFTLKPIVTYWMTQETAQGKVRMDETRTQSVFALLGSIAMSCATSSVRRRRSTQLALP